MTVIKDHNHEGTPSTNATAANTGYSLASGRAGVFDTQHLHGSTSIHWVPGAFGYLEDTGLAQTNLWARTYLYLTSAPTGNDTILQVSTSSGTAKAQIQTNPSRQIRVRSGTTLVTTLSAISLNTWYRLEWNVAATTQQCLVYAGDNATAVSDSGSVSCVSGVADQLYVGAFAANTGDFNFDDTTLADAKLGPISGGGSRSGLAKVWDGSAWAQHQAKVWDGSAWVNHDMKGYDGTSWVTAK